MTQKISSKNTALNQIASTFKAKRYAELFADSIVLDYGCGKGLSRDYCLNTLQVKNWYGWDKFNDGFTDKTVISRFIEDAHDGKNRDYKKVITVNNVLNVLQNEQDIKVIFAFCLSMIKHTRNCTVIFKIYEGNKSGNGKTTKRDCYQRNERTAVYEKMLNEFIKKVKIETDFHMKLNVQRHGQYIEVSRV